MASITENTFTLAEARPEFTELSEDAVWAFVRSDIYNEHAVTAEVNRLVAEYTKIYLDCVRRHGPVPGQIMYVRVNWPIERVAVALMIEGLEGQVVATTGPQKLH